MATLSKKYKPGVLIYYKNPIDLSSSIIQGVVAQPDDLCSHKSGGKQLSVKEAANKNSCKSPVVYAFWGNHVRTSSSVAGWMPESDVNYVELKTTPNVEIEKLDSVKTTHLCHCDYTEIIRKIGCQCGGK